jgi:hypothetical protein
LGFRQTAVRQINRLPFTHFSENSTMIQSYDREIQHQRCKNLQRHELPRAFRNQKYSGANPTIVIYNASIVNFYNATGSLARFENKKYFILL